MGQDTSSQALGKPLHYARGCTVPGRVGQCWAALGYAGHVGLVVCNGVAWRGAAQRGAAASTEDPREAGCRWLPGKGQPCRISSFPSLRPEKEAADAALAVAVRRGVAPSLRATRSNLHPGSSIPSGLVHELRGFAKKVGLFCTKGWSSVAARRANGTARHGRARAAPGCALRPQVGLGHCEACTASQPSLAGCTLHGRVRGHSVRVHADHDNGSVRCAFLGQGPFTVLFLSNKKIDWKEKFLW